MLPHHDGSATYVSDPTPGLGDSVTVWLLAPADVRGVVVRSVLDGEPAYVDARPDARVGSCGLGVGVSETRWWRAEIVVRNPVTGYRFLLIGEAGRYWLNALGVAHHDVPDCYDFRLVAHAPAPGWARDAVVYEIFPDRFARSTGWSERREQLPAWAIDCEWDTPVIGSGAGVEHQVYGGDLDGITEHLAHIAALGANTVYLTPIFPARSNHRYNAASFETVDPLLGGAPALERLVAGLDSRGMRLIGDITTNHCGDDHPWFTAALAGGAERDFFYFDVDTGAGAGAGPAGGGGARADGYESWCGVSTLPKFNWNSAELRRRVLGGGDSAGGKDSVIAGWLAHFDGWRVDVANMTGRRGTDDLTHEVARLLRATAVAARPDALVVAEHGHDFTGDLDRGGWHGTMNYAGFTRPVWSWLRAAQLDLPEHQAVPGGITPRDGTQTVAAIRAFCGLVSWQALTASWTILSSHDTPRIRTIVGDGARVEVAVGLLMTFPGTPMIFAGDEWGLTGVSGEASRTPMPWHRPEHRDSRTLAVYRALIALRLAHPALREGGMRWAYIGKDALAFLRESLGETLLVYARRAAGDPVVIPWFQPSQVLRSGAPVGENVYGGAELATVDGSAVLPGDGPTFQIWRL